MEDVADSIIGQVIGERYSVLNEIGSGGYGVVYRAKHVHLGHPVAVKLLHAHLMSQEENVARFRREAEATRRLRHPAIASVFDFGMLPDGRPYMVMEYLQGETLADVIKTEGAQPWQRLCPLFTESCEALDYAHKLGLLHRDIKPDNIFIVRGEDGSEHAKLLDFGLAKVLFGETFDIVSLTQSGYVMGTPWYMSPEQCTAQTLDARSDIYSLACSLYEALSGRKPFGGKTLYDTLHAHMNEDAAPLAAAQTPHSIPVQVEEAIATALQKSPKDRFADVLQFKDAFLSAPRDGQVLQRSSTSPPAASPGKSETGGVTQKMLIALVAVLCAMIAYKLLVH